MKTINEIRLAAADLLESRPNAWTQGNYRKTNDDGSYCYCLIGACREAAGFYAADAADADAAATTAAADSVRAAAWAADGAAAWAAADAVCAAAAWATAANAAAAVRATAANWNDMPERTVTEVIAALRAI